MESLIQYIRLIVEEAAQKAFTEKFEMQITPATQDKFGHYQCNSAMGLAKTLKKAPRAIAEELVAQIDPTIFKKIEVAGPGFINLTLKAGFLSDRLNKMAVDSRLGIPRPDKPERIIVEFSSPNIAKEMHVGHLRSTIIGDSLARLFEFLGHDVVRLNHVGDWGTAFGMLIAYMREEASDVLEGKKQTDLPTLMEFYRSSKKRFDEDEAFKIRAREAVVALQSGDLASLEAWKMICHISRIAFEEVYNLLDVHLSERGESFYNPMLPEVVADLEAKGLIEISDGAKCIFHEGIKIPLMVQKTDGGYNYDTTDMAAILHRVEDERANRIIVITDAGQSLHFELVRKTAEKAGYLDPKKVRFDHVTFGVVLGSDGKKFKTRSGDVERLIDLLDESVVQAKKILANREIDMSEKEQNHLAKILGIDAVKYADLCCNRVGDYTFSYERMLRFEGNTAAFILYSYVRVNGIKRKIGKTNLKNAKIEIQHPSEIDLGVHLLRFYETLQAVEQDLLPNYLTDYLYNLAQKFNAFFRDCRVEGDEYQNPRLLLCEAVARIMRQGLQILGLQVVERM